MFDLFACEDLYTVWRARNKVCGQQVRCAFEAMFKLAQHQYVKVNKF